MPADWTKGAPWNWNLNTKSKKKVLPEGFIELYGSKPSWADYWEGGGKFRISYPEYKVLVVQWETKLKHYKGPVYEYHPGTNVEKLDISLEIYVSWEMGGIDFYDSTYGVKGRFLDSNLPDYSFSFHQLVEFPQHVVSQYHIEQILRGMDTPNPLHYFVYGGIVKDIKGYNPTE